MKSSKKTSIAIIGGGGHTKSILSVLAKHKDFTILGYTDLVDKGAILGAPYLGVDNVLIERKINSISIGISYLKSPLDRQLRLSLIRKYESLNFHFPTIVSPTAIINAEVSIGAGTIIFDGCVINAGTSISKHSVINTGAIIEHDCQIGNNVFISPRSVVCGHTFIGNNVFVGAGSVIKDALNIVDDVVIGTGSNVVKDIQIAGLYLGNPAILVKPF
jgi:sugar O-acyltransferase (sialic acid O-acetyltransferase NeuD family)